MAYINSNFSFIHPVLGKVHVAMHPTSKRISGRWTLNYLKITVPRGVRRKNIDNFLTRFENRFIETKPTSVIPDYLNFEDWSIKIGEQSFKPDKLLIFTDLHDCFLRFGTKMVLNDDDKKVFFDKALMAIARKIAPQKLLPLANNLAGKIGDFPTKWKISHGTKTLGHCNSRREIGLSYMIMFLPIRLREYIICHELAHLKEMNHSAKFHSLCNSYTNGNEKLLRKELREFKWPVRR